MWGLLCGVILCASLHQITKAKVVPMDYSPGSSFDDAETMLEAKPYRLPFDNGFKKTIENSYALQKRIGDKIKKPCAIVVLSNVQNANMHSLLRKYRYDSNGVLIPSSVKYFVKLPNSVPSSTVLVPLHDRAFSPLGGFVTYYKEVPPIPQAW